jgi:hypothetical protein
MKQMNFADVVDNQLSDGSYTHDVMVHFIGGKIRIHADRDATANAMCHAINNGTVDIDFEKTRMPDIYTHSIFVEGDNPRKATDTEETAIRILELAIAAIQNDPDVEHAETNDCDAMDLAIRVTRWATGLGQGQ